MPTDEELKNERELKRQQWQELRGMEEARLQGVKMAKESPAQFQRQQLEAQRREIERIKMAPKLEEFRTREAGEAAMSGRVPQTPEGVAAQLKGERAKETAALGGWSEKGVAGLAARAVKEQSKSLTAEALKQSWLNLIDSFGLTYFYILFHFICKYIAQIPFFCRFGEEWMSSLGGGGAAAGGAAGAGGAAKAATSGAGPSVGASLPAGGGAQAATQASAAAGAGKPPAAGERAEGAPGQPPGAAQAIMGLEIGEVIVVLAGAVLLLFIILTIGVMFYFFMHPCVLVEEGLEGWGIIAKLGNLVCKLKGEATFYQFIK